MSYSPMLIVDICGGTLGLLSGTAALAFRKGSPAMCSLKESLLSQC